MKSMNRSTLTLGLAALAFGVAHAQGSWTGECVDPANTSAYSTPYIYNILATQLIGVAYGISGTVTQGGTTGPCFSTARQLQLGGRFAFGVPGAGSAQSTFDDGMALTMGWPDEPVGDYNYAMITGPDGALNGAEIFGGADGAGITTTFVGASDRYAILGMVMASGSQVQLEVRVIADAVRMTWNFIDTASVGGFGVYWVTSPWMRIGGFDYLGFNQANSAIGSLSGFPKVTAENYLGYAAFDDSFPMRTSKKRELSDSNFPKKLQVLWGQSEPYGIQYDTGSSSSFPKASQTDYIKVGSWFESAQDNAPSLNLFGDPTGQLDDNDVFFAGTGIAVIQHFIPQSTGANGRAKIVQYVHTNWSTGFYDDPYTAVLDAPHTINYDGPGAGSSPNPMTIRVWIDNQYATIDEEVALHNVSAQIDLPAGFTLAPGEQQVKNIALINPNQIRSLEWQVVSDGETFGTLPVSVTIKTVPGPTKVLTQTVRVGASPVMSLAAGPNMVGFPYTFGDSSFDGILGLTSGVDFVAYQWDPTLRAYVPTTSSQRGVGYWVVPNAAHPSLQLNNANIPADIGTGGLLVNLKPGWNLVSNPYNYAVPIKQLLGVAEDDNTESLTWTELVTRRYVASNLTYFVPNSSLPGGGSYALQSDSGEMQPHKAYWIFVSASKDVRLIWPPLFELGVPNSGRSVGDSFAQSDREWRLQLSARSTAGVDTQNYIGVVTDSKKAQTLQVPKAPQAPGQKLEMAVLGDFNGQPTRMAQSVSARAGRQEYKVQVSAEEPGDVTVTWPNLPSLPRNLRVKITDDATGEKRDLRATSGYTFHMDQAGTRSLTVTVEAGGSARPVIGNVVVSTDGRAPGSPITVNYSLSADALVTVRVLSSTGKEVFTVTRSRSDNAGENSATWTLRDNANRAVAPGSYKVEILAETPNGERVRKVVPVNVIR